MSMRPEEDDDSATRIITYTDALAMLGGDLTGVIVDMNVHYTDDADGPYWLSGDFEDLIGLADHESN